MDKNKSNQNRKNTNQKGLTVSQKKAFIKMAGFLVLAIVLFAALSRTMFSGGETLYEYAQENPDVAYGNDVTVPNDEHSNIYNTADVVGDTSDTLTADDSDTVGNTDITADNVQADDSVETEDGAGKTVDVNAGDGMDTTDNIGADTDVADNDNAGTSNAGADIANRTTYQPDFYYEPLSEELKEAITGISFPTEGAAEISYEDLAYVHVLHCDFNGETAQGELICNKAIAQDLAEIFYELYVAEYQIEKIVLIDNYGGDDNASMEDNNTSCFNYRTVDGTSSLSKHALGLAIDINPFYNPYVRFTKEGGQIVLPEGSEHYADRSLAFPYKIDTSDLCYRLFMEHGFTWGGNWNSSKDYQHFQKVID